MYVNIAFAIAGGHRRASPSSAPRTRVPSGRGSTSPASSPHRPACSPLVYGFAHAETTSWGDPRDGRRSSPRASCCSAAFVAIQRRVANRCCRCASCSIATAAARSWRSRSSARHVRRVPVPHLLPAAALGLLADPDRARVPADGRRADGHRHHGHRPASRRATGPRPLVPVGMALAAGGCSLLPARDGLHLRGRRPARAAAAGPRHGSGLRAGDEHRHRAASPTRRGRRLGDGQHLAAGRRRDRHRPAEHDLRLHGDELRRQPRRRSGRGRVGLHGGLQHRLPAGPPGSSPSAPWSPRSSSAAARLPSRRPARS